MHPCETKMQAPWPIGRETCLTGERREEKNENIIEKKNWYLASIIVCLYALMHVYSLVCLSGKLDEGREMGLVG